MITTEGLVLQKAEEHHIPIAIAKEMMMKYEPADVLAAIDLVLADKGCCPTFAVAELLEGI